MKIASKVSVQVSKYNADKIGSGNWTDRTPEELEAALFHLEQDVADLIDEFPYLIKHTDKSKGALAIQEKLKELQVL
jgi:hypothetical protein